MMYLHLARQLFSETIHLRLDRIDPADPVGKLVPSFHFAIENSQGERVGHINFRVGNTRHILQCAGHVGFEIHPQHQGKAYAFHACQALAPFIRQFYSHVILTSDPSNAPSIRTLEKLGAEYLDEVDVSADDPAYGAGARQKKRYAWTP